MAAVIGVGDNLIVKSILNADFDFNDAFAGSANKSTVLNRVKKMSQAERKELITELENISKIILLTGPNNPPPLKERGLCALLMADDGKVESKSCFIVSFVLGFFNLIGARTSSSSIVNKITETRAAALNGNRVIPILLDVKTDLEAQILNLEQQERAPAQDENIRSLIRDLKTFRTEGLRKILAADWDGLATFIDLEVLLESIKSSQAIVAPEVKRIIDGHLTTIKTLVVKPIGCLVSFNEYKKNNTKIIEIGLKKIEIELRKIISLNLLEKANLQKEINVVKTRLSTYEQNVSSTLERRNKATSELIIADASKQIKTLAVVCEALEALEKKNASFQTLAIAVRSVNSKVQIASGDVKNSNNFGLHFALLAQLAANDPTLNKQNLADAINLSVLSQNPTHRGLHDRLNQFKTDPNGNFPNSDELKRVLINDYVAYWKILFNRLKEQQEERLGSEKAKFDKKVPAPIPTQQPSPSVNSPVRPPAAQTVNEGHPGALIIPTINDAGLRRALTNSSTARRTSISNLITIANGLQAVGEDSYKDFGWYRQVQTPTIDEETVKIVHGRFYKIMKDLQKLGSVDAKGDSPDSNWGGNVFTTGLSNGHPPAGVSRPLLNHYRVKAIVEVLNGQS